MMSYAELNPSYGHLCCIAQDRSSTDHNGLLLLLIGGRACHTIRQWMISWLICAQQELYLVCLSPTRKHVTVTIKNLEYRFWTANCNNTVSPSQQKKNARKKTSIFLDKNELESLLTFAEFQNSELQISRESLYYQAKVAEFLSIWQKVRTFWSITMFLFIV